MHDRTARMFSGLGVLVMVWIVVYWAWPMGDGEADFTGISMGETGEGAGTALMLEGETSVERFAPVDEFLERLPENDNDPEAAVGGVIPPEFKEYVIRDGDTFERISRRVYGVRRHAMAIGRANPLLDPRKLREGQTIRVPVDPTNIQGKPVVAEGDEGEQGEPEPALPAPVIEYTVMRGDTLGGIAKSFYGSILYVDFLYEANRDRLSSKNDLGLGQVLLIPPLRVGAGDD